MFKKMVSWIDGWGKSEKIVVIGILSSTIFVGSMLGHNTYIDSKCMVRDSYGSKHNLCEYTKMTNAINKRNSEPTEYERQIEQQNAEYKAQLFDIAESMDRNK